jgi:transposase
VPWAIRCVDTSRVVQQATDLLDETGRQAWRGGAWRSRIPEFVEPQRKVKCHMDATVAPATFGLTNARVEVVNNKIKLIVKMAYGFRNIDNLFSVVMLKCSDLQVALPGRTA